MATWCEELTHWKRPWFWKRLKAGEKGIAEDETVGWHHQLYGHSLEKALGIGDWQRSLVCCSPWGCKEMDMTEQMNWLTEVSFVWQDFFFFVLSFYGINFNLLSKWMLQIFLFSSIYHCLEYLPFFASLFSFHFILQSPRISLHKWEDTPRSYFFNKKYVCNLMYKLNSNFKQSHQPLGSLFSVICKWTCNQ